jgi:hypothetical protein
MKMTERIPASTVIAGLSTTSDKIRALTRNGYLRTEISEILNIRYQHVRKVLADANITDGLQRDVEFERLSVSVQVSLEPRKPTSSEVLLRAGFRFLGEWVSLGDGEFELDAKAPAEAGVYAFAVDDWVMYVGLTHTGIRTRMGHYRRGHTRQRTSARVKKLIAVTLSEGKHVKVLIATPESLEWNGLSVNTAAGLEAGLIRMIRPDWNVLGASSAAARL